MKKKFLNSLLSGVFILSLAIMPEAFAEPWVFPVKKNVVIKNIPDWGNEGFTLEVWCKPEKTDCGYAVLMRGSFGYPKFFGQRDIDCYLINADGKTAAGRVYTPLEVGKYHYYVLTCDQTKSIAYRDGKLMRTNKGCGIPKYIPNTPLYIGNSIGWADNFVGEVAVVRIHNRVLTAQEIQNNYQALQNNKALPQNDSLILNEDRRELLPAGVESSSLEMSGVEPCGAPDNAWVFPSSKSVRINDIPDWGKEGFSLEVWCMPETTDCGYAVLMRGSFGYPKFFGKKDIDCYLINAAGKTAAGRIYTPLEVGRYHYYVLTATQNGSIAYRDGKLMRENSEPGIPKYDPSTPLLIGNSIGWAQNFKGRIAVVRIHNRALTAQEIKSNYLALQKNMPLGASESAIVNIDRRVTGNFYKFNPGDTSTLKFTCNGMISFTVSPAELSDSDLVKMGDLTIRCTADGSLVCQYGSEVMTAEKVLKVNAGTTIAFAWNGSQGGFFVDGKACGGVVSCNVPAGEQSVVVGGNFNGIIGKFENTVNTLLPKNVGAMITVPLDNVVVDQVAYPRSRHLEGKSEDIRPLISFDDLSGWTMSYTSGAVKPRITRSKEEPLWSDYVLRTEFGKGDYPANDAKVVLTPPQPIKITEDFDTIAIWRFATQYGQPRPALSYSIQYRDSAGNLHDTGNMGGMLENGWGIHMRPLAETVKAPAEIVSITFRGFNEAKRVTYFDSVHVYKRPAGALTDARVMSFAELGVPNNPDTIKPTAVSPGKVELKQAGNSWIFESVNADGKKLVFTVTPASGTLSDISVTYNDTTFKPMDGGGFYWATNDIYPVRNDALLAPNNSRVSAKLVKASMEGKQLLLDWIYSIDNQEVSKASWILEVKDNTLIADLKSSEPRVGEFKFGAVTGISGKVVEIPYLNLGRWIHSSNPPGIFAGNNIYISAFVDWYNSDASGLFGESSSTPGGHFVLNPVTADHRWVADPNAGDTTNTVREVSIINGGSYYWPKTDGKRNPARERIMLTVSDTVASVLPNIPNPAREYLQTTTEEVWATRMWYCKLPYMNYFEEEFAQWQECYDYGMVKLNVRLHGNINRMYDPRRDGGPSTFIKSFTEPRIGGDEKLAEFFAKMRNLNYRIGIYTDHMLLNPVARDAWDLDLLNLDSNGNWLYSSGNCKQTKISCMVDLQKKFNALYREMFKPTCGYLDQITCPPCWRYTDYDVRSPEAGKFSAAYRVFVESLRAEEADFGPVLSEGKTQMFFAGLCDSYAQPQRMHMNVIPDFNLRKLHMLNNDCGYELGWINYKGATGGEPQKWSYKLLAYEYVYGNTGHVLGNYHGAPLTPLKDFFIRSYFLIQPAQKYFAQVPVKEIFYNVNGKLGTIEDAIQAGTLDCNQIKLVYENGLEVAVNLNEKADFTVALHGKEYTLPPEGFAAVLPGKLLAYSALNSNGKRADLMMEGNLIYCAGAPDIDAIKAQYDYTLRALDGNKLELTPAPFKKAETVSLKVPFTGKASVVGVDRQGGEVFQGVLSVVDGRLEIPIDGKAFRYLIESK